MGFFTTITNGCASFLHYRLHFSICLDICGPHGKGGDWGNSLKSWVSKIYEIISDIAFINFCFLLDCPIVKESWEKEVNELLMQYLIVSGYGHNIYMFHYYFCEILNFANVVSEFNVFDILSQSIVEDKGFVTV